MATDNFGINKDNVSITPIMSYLDDNGFYKIKTPHLASYNFDGVIPLITENLSASAIRPGMSVSFTGSADFQTYYPVVAVGDVDEAFTASPLVTVYFEYLDNENNLQSAVYGASSTLSVRYQDWDNKYLGTSGWYLNQDGNAIFSNVAVRGEIEATTLDVGGIDGITYDGNTVIIGASVTINAPVTFTGGTGSFVTFDYLSASYADLTELATSGTTIINGGNITTGTINANLVNVTNINASNITSGSITGRFIAGASVSGGIITSGSFVGGILQSPTYSGVTDGSEFSTTGTHLNLNTGAITARQFRIQSDGSATFGGSLSAATGTFAGSLSAATGTFSGTLSANSITGGTINGSVVNVTNLNASNIVAGILQGIRIRTNGLGDQIEMSTDAGAFGADAIVYHRNNEVTHGIFEYDGGSQQLTQLRIMRKFGDADVFVFGSLGSYNFRANSIESTGQIKGDTFVGPNNKELRQILVETGSPTSPGSYVENTLWIVV